jgi:hypothetical protein
MIANAGAGWRPSTWRGLDVSILDRYAHKESLGHTPVTDLSIRVLLEAVLRNCDGFEVSEEDVRRLANWNAPAPQAVELPFKPARVILQDFTGVPVLVDIAAMRSAVARLGGDPKKINPLVPVDLVIDHSVQVDHFGASDSLSLNLQVEFHRNRERYQFLRGGRTRFQELHRRAAGHGHRAPGQRRAPRHRGAQRQGRRRGRGLPRHPRRHRLAHHHDQRPRASSAGASAASRPRP